jgi:hypothetical protein
MNLRTPKHYLRAYEGDGYQTVLYPVPPNGVLQETEERNQ